MADDIITIGNRQFRVTSGDGSALSDAERSDAALQFMKQQPPQQTPSAAPTTPSLGQQFSQGIGAVKQWATAPPDPTARDITGLSRDNPVANTLRAIGGAILPGSAPELAGQAALMAVPGGFLARTGAGMAASGGTAALTGESPLSEATKTGIGSAVGTGVTRALGGVGNYLANRVNPAILDRIRGLWTNTLGQAIDQDVPAFAGQVRSPEDLLRLRDQGPQILRGLYQQFEQDGSRAFANRSMPIQLQTPGGPQNVPMSFGDAMDRLLMLKAQARAADPGSLGHAERETARQFEESFVRALPQNLASTYGSIVQQYNKGLSLLGALKSSGMFGQSGAAQTPLEPANLTRYAAQNIENFSPRQFPNVWGALSRGGQLGTTDVTAQTAAGRIYSPFEGRLPVRISEALPRFERMQLAGGQPVNPSMTAQTLQAVGSPTGQRSASIAATPQGLDLAGLLNLIRQHLVGGARNQ